MKCPECSSHDVHSSKKGYSLKKGALGVLLTGGVGLLGGLIGSNKIAITCLSCGHNFKPGQGGADDQITLSNEQSEIKNCEASEAARKALRGVKKTVARTTIPRSTANVITRKKIVCVCGALNEMRFKYCRICGINVDLKTMQIVKNGQDFEYESCKLCNSLTPKQSRKCKFCTCCGGGFDNITEVKQAENAAQD